MPRPKPIEIDGRTGEGGGQLVRIAVTLAAVASQPVRVVHVRGNREGPRGGGLKSQHVTSIDWLAKATGAEVTGLSVGSHTLEFHPRRRPSALTERSIKIKADSAAASTLLIFQAILPFLLFAGNGNEDDDDGKKEPIEVEISGGTNVSWSLSYEYLDQVLLPSLQYEFGIKVERQLRARGWSMGPPQRGTVWFKIQPLAPGQTLKPLRDPFRKLGEVDFSVRSVDASIIAPRDMHESLVRALSRDLDKILPDTDINFVLAEDSGHDARMYVLLVARSDTLRWGRDLLFSESRKGKTKAVLSDLISRKVVRDLRRELGLRGAVDEFLQDQMVIFQALAEGKTSYLREARPDSQDEGSEIGELEKEIGDLSIEERLRQDRIKGPFGVDSTHTTTARWVAAELLPHVKWFENGSICEGVGMRMEDITLP